ncbi:hypothetical protein EZS27_043159, partial [termite gut metagenome]
LFSSVLYAQNPDALRCEYLINPLGIDVDSPRLSWMLNDERQDAVQNAYRIVVGIDSLAVTQGKGTAWNSQKQVSDKMLVAYQGKRLEPFTKYYWQIQIWDKDNTVRKSIVASFEIGMRGNNWQGAWISDRHGIDYKPAPYFRKTFPIKQRIKSGRVYVAVAGLYELSMNGEKIGNHRLDPTYTRFDRRTL